MFSKKKEPSLLDEWHDEYKYLLRREKELKRNGDPNKELGDIYIRLIGLSFASNCIIH